MDKFVFFSFTLSVSFVCYRLNWGLINLKKYGYIPCTKLLTSKCYWTNIFRLNIFCESRPWMNFMILNFIFYRQTTSFLVDRNNRKHQCIHFIALSQIIVCTIDCIGTWMQKMARLVIINLTQKYTTLKIVILLQ